MVLVNFINFFASLSLFLGLGLALVWAYLIRSRLGRPSRNFLLDFLALNRIGGLNFLARPNWLGGLKKSG
jgi:hypothetical protein